MSDSGRAAQSILVVDDEEPALRSVRRTLRSRGFESVLTCSDSRKVLELLETEAVAAVLLDLIMPELSGEELLAEYRKAIEEVEAR